MNHVTSTSKTQLKQWVVLKEDLTEMRNLEQKRDVPVGEAFDRHGCPTCF